MSDPTMTPEQLLRIAARTRAAQAGPWKDDVRSVVRLAGTTQTGGILAYCHEAEHDDVSYPRHPNHTSQMTAVFIAHSRKDVPDLLAYVALLESLLSDRVQESDLANWAVRRERERCAHICKTTNEQSVACELIREGYQPTEATA